MEKGEILHFLAAVDAELVSHCKEGERLDIYLLGRAAMILRYGLQLATKDVDVVSSSTTPSLQQKAIELFAPDSSNALKWGLYLEPVPEGLPPLPGSYRRLSVEIPGDWKVLRPRQLDPHDLAVSKLKRFHAGDREDLRIMADAGDLTVEGLQRALDSAFAWAADEDDDPGRKRANESFRKVVAYLEGRTVGL